MKRSFFIQLLFIFNLVIISAQENKLYVPPLLTGKVFNLEIRDSITEFWPGVKTKTYGINHNILAPTLLLQKGDSVQINVTNRLVGSGNSTTIHWHGLHVSAMNDGGPHQIIQQNATWSPKFKVLNNAGTFWYHPHGENKTDRHVSKGIAGAIVIKDPEEALLNLPRTYAIDDIPIIIQTKEIDVLNQITIASFLDTAVMVNATVKPYYDLPAQVVRLRLLNGASTRTFMIGFSNNMPFSLIATDGGLRDSSLQMTRLLLSNGERAEILVNFTGMMNDSVYLRSYGSELPKGIFGADSVGDKDNLIMNYYENPLNGTDFDLVKFRIKNSTANPVTAIPTALANTFKYLITPTSKYRKFILDTLSGIGIIPTLAEGPFAFNRKLFDIDRIDEVVYLNATEVWTIHNKTMIAHPFHIHDVEFDILDINGMAPPKYLQGKKDVVLVMPGDSVRFITKFEDFADNMVPYMYHCHVLHHEDDGMMGSFTVIDTSLKSDIHFFDGNEFVVYPNPVHDFIKLKIEDREIKPSLIITNIIGEIVKRYESISNNETIDLSQIVEGVYFIKLQYNNQFYTKKICKQ